MLPYPEEVLREVRWAMDHVIRPALSDPYAVEQAKLAANLVEHVRLRLLHETEVLREDSEDIWATLARVGHAPAEAGTSPTEAESQASELERLRWENQYLSQRLQDAIADLEASHETQAEEALQELRPLLVRQLERQKRMLGPGYVAGT